MHVQEKQKRKVYRTQTELGDNLTDRSENEDTNQAVSTQTGR